MKSEREIQFAKNISRLMAARNLTLSALAMKTGISKSTLHGYCNGTCPRNLKTICRIADFFGVPIHELISSEKLAAVSINVSGDIEGEYSVIITKKNKL